MITYSKAAWGLHLLLRLYGSAFPRSIIFSAVSTGIAAALYAKKRPEINDDWRHPYPFQAFAFIVGFAIVFRSQLSYARYWEGRLQLQTMTSRWATFCTEALTMDAGTLPENEASDPKAIHKAQLFAQTLVHLSSLLHAVALQHLRSDWELGNLTPYDPSEPPPPLDAAGLANKPSGGYMHSLWDFFLLRGAIEQRDKYNRAMPFAVISALSSAELNGLGQMNEKLSTDETGTLMTGCDIVLADDSWLTAWIKALFVTRSGRHVPGATERVSVVYTWVQQLLQDRLREGGLCRDAPIGSRMWQVLTDGYLQFEQCRAVADTPFPFPWAQSVLILLILYAISVPLIVVAFINSTWQGLVVNFLCVQSYWCLNEVARDLEDPFVYDPNDLPLSRYQYQFNNRILAAAAARRPFSNCETHTLESMSAASMAAAAPTARAAAATTNGMAQPSRDRAERQRSRQLV